ncbi:DoxX family protein [Sphingomonas sp.]|uniref:DoxX family protein n=1 Tax=Sphingomonas sp. TaxID=28214 RepID=UPI001B2101E8|nr:DoxX family protein [Sphingomonas sp.]MBO9712001.1 DoxX family protein [Sphingomonas sp.]
MTPGFVDNALGWRWSWPLAKLALVGAYLLGAAQKLLDFPGAVAEQAHFGLNPPALFAVLTILVELVGPALILSGRLVWLGAGMLGVFTGLAALTANAFWTMSGHEAFMARNAFFEHLGLIGGFVLVAMLDRRRP